MSENPQLTITYCLIPRELAGELHEQLRQYWRGHRSLVVVVERRSKERRGAQRRQVEAEPPLGMERRTVHSPTGRRVADRRAPSSRVIPPGLPPGAQRYASRLRFIVRQVPGARAAEDIDSARLVVAFQRGNLSVFEELYLRYFDRIYACARVTLRDSLDAEIVTQRVFTLALEWLPALPLGGARTFRSWLFQIAAARIASAFPAHIRMRRQQSPRPEVPRGPEGEVPEQTGLKLFSDADIYLFVEELPPSQREVLALRYVLEMSFREIATALDLDPNTVGQLHERALRMLRGRLGQAGPGGDRTNPAPMRRRSTLSPVLTTRRLALRAAAAAR